MTVKEAMTKVSEDRETFPKGWNTEMKEVYAKCGGELYERRQKRVWLMVAINQNTHDADDIRVFRTEAKAKAAMEEDIEKVVNCDDPHCSPEDLRREGTRKAELADELAWEVKPVDLIA